MRWFKHMAHSANDEKLARLMDKCGLEGYGFWWRVLEIVAGNMDGSDRTRVGFSAKRWCNQLGVRPQTLRKLLAASGECGLFAISFEADLISVDVPNLLKFRDEYSGKQARKSGRAPARKTEAEAEAEQGIKKASKGAAGPENRRSYDAMIAEYTAHPELRRLLGEFIVMRQRTRAPVTNEALARTFQDLDKFAPGDETAKAAIVGQSIQRGWRGVFPLKTEDGAGGRAGGAPPQSWIERENARIRAEIEEFERQRAAGGQQA